MVQPEVDVDCQNSKIFDYIIYINKLSHQVETQLLNPTEKRSLAPPLLTDRPEYTLKYFLLID